jgi:hypothetical protein
VRARPAAEGQVVLEQTVKPPDEPSTPRRLFPRRVLLVCLLVLLAQGLALAVLARGLHDPRPHDAPIAVVAPTAVAQVLADRFDALDGAPLDAVASTDRAAAVGDVRQGVTVAALVVDLSHARDMLVLSSAIDERLARAVTAEILTTERSLGRTVEVRRVSIAAASNDVVRRVAVAAGLLGFLIALVVSLVRGPVARTLRIGVGRMLGVSAVSLVAGYLAVLVVPGLGGLDPSSRLQVAVVLALSAFVAAAVTLALEGLAGFGGLGLSGVIYLVLATPQVLRSDPRLLPSPWPTLAGWTPPGASVDAVGAIVLFGGSGIRVPVLVLVVWLLSAILALLVARRERNAMSHQPRGGPRSSQRHRVRRWRWRVAVVVLPAAAAALLLVSFVPRDAVAHTAPLVDQASQTPCVRTGALDTVADLNRIARTLRGGPDFLGADVGADAVLQDGRRVMVFGDTLRGEHFTAQDIVRNSMLVLGGDCLQSVVRAHGALVPDRLTADPYPVGYWPMSVTTVPEPGYDLLVVGCQRVRGTGGDGFENLGPAIALFVVSHGGTPQLMALRDVGPDSADITRPTWGAAAALDGGWLYLYGTANPREPYVFGFSLRVARVRPEDVLRLSAWEYWNGFAWVTDPAAAQELIPAPGGTSQTLSVFEEAGTWYALSKRDEYLGHDIVVWRAPTPWGPFDGGTTVAPLPSDPARGRLRYMPLAHPDLLPRPGTVVVSYSRNTTAVGRIAGNPLLYRQRFLRVKLP